MKIKVEKIMRKLIDDVANQLEEDSAWDNPYPVLPHESENKDYEEYKERRATNDR